MTIDTEPLHLHLVEPPAPETAADVVDTYARQVDELAAMLEAEASRAAHVHRVIANALGELHSALDELQVRIRREGQRP